MKKNKFLLIMACVACLGGAASLSIANAADIKAMVGAGTNNQWTLSFNSSKGELRKLDSGSFLRTGATQSGTPAHLYSKTGATNYTVPNNYVAGFQGKFDQGQDGAGLISFSSSLVSDVPFRFQNLKSIYAKTTKTLNNLIVETSYDGVSWTAQATRFSISTAGSTYALDHVNYVRLKTDAAPTFAICFEEVSVEYECGEAEHRLSSLTVDDSSVQKTFDIGEAFNYEGLTAKATYLDGAEVDVTDDMVVTAPDMSTAGDKEVICAYTEGGVTVEDKYIITVNAQGFQGAGKYVTASYYFLELKEDFTGSYEYQGVAKLYFNYTVDLNSIRITLDETKHNDDNTDFGTNRLFGNGTTVNSSGVYDPDNQQIYITTYTVFSGSTKTFTLVK